MAPVIVETPITIPETNDDFANRASINPLLGPVSDSNQLATVEPGEPLPDGLPGGKSIWFTWHADFHRDHIIDNGREAISTRCWPSIPERN